MDKEPEFKHCFDYMDDETQPECLRNLVKWFCRPALDRYQDTNPEPVCFATVKETLETERKKFLAGDRVQITFVSRMGDVGISEIKQPQTESYQMRVFLSRLKDFSEDVI